MIMMVIMMINWDHENDGDNDDHDNHDNDDHDNHDNHDDDDDQLGCSNSNSTQTVKLFDRGTRQSFLFDMMDSALRWTVCIYIYSI